MSYDLQCRGDEAFGEFKTRDAVAQAISALDGIEPNGNTGYVFQRGDKVYMEIDVELVSDEGDNIEEEGEASPEFNCINFHVPYGFIDGLDQCMAAALQIANGVGWELYDQQLDKMVTTDSMNRPWWKFW